MGVDIPSERESIAAIERLRELARQAEQLNNRINELPQTAAKPTEILPTQRSAQRPQAETGHRTD
jgi:hypothetical protein